MPILADALLPLVRHWIQSVRSSQSDRIERDLDKAGALSFPASDPIAPGAITTRTDRLQHLHIEVTCERLMLAWVDADARNAADGDLQEIASEDLSTASGDTVHVKVFAAPGVPEQLSLDAAGALASAPASTEPFAMPTAP